VRSSSLLQCEQGRNKEGPARASLSTLASPAFAAMLRGAPRLDGDAQRLQDADPDLVVEFEALIARAQRELDPNAEVVRLFPR
jgi:hypothetical protein